MYSTYCTVQYLHTHSRNCLDKYFKGKIIYLTFYIEARRDRERDRRPVPQREQKTGPSRYYEDNRANRSEVQNAKQLVLTNRSINESVQVTNESVLKFFNLLDISTESTNLK